MDNTQSAIIKLFNTGGKIGTTEVFPFKVFLYDFGISNFALFDTDYIILSIGTKLGYVQITGLTKVMKNEKYRESDVKALIDTQGEIRQL